MAYTYTELSSRYFSDDAMTGGSKNPWDLLADCRRDLRCPASKNEHGKKNIEIIGEINSCNDDQCCLCGEEIILSFTLEKHYQSISIITIDHYHIICRRCFWNRAVVDDVSLEVAKVTKREKEQGRENVFPEANLFIQIGKYYLPGMMAV
jgi:hypothetical protein